MLQLLAIVGSNYNQSTNRKLLQFIAKHFQEKAIITLVEINDFPIFSKDKIEMLPKKIVNLEEKIEQADGLLISTSEYDHSIPAVLMNLLEWLSVGKQVLVDKPILIMGASYGTLGTSRAQAQLRQILLSPELGANLLPSAEFLLSHSLEAFDDKGMLKDLKTIAQLEALFNQFLIFVNNQNQFRVERKEHQKQAQELASHKILDYKGETT